MESKTMCLLLMTVSMTVLITSLYVNLHLITAGTLEKRSELTPNVKQQRTSQEERFATLSRICKRLNNHPNRSRKLPQVNLQGHVLTRLYVSDRYSLVYCEVPKAGCTNWKRVLLAMAGNANLYKTLPEYSVHVLNKYTTLRQFNPVGQRFRLDNYTMMMFVREPMERLVSAYRNKLQYKSDYYYKRVYGRGIIKHYRKNPSNESLAKGHDVTFPEFVRFILDPRRPLQQDPHWLPAHHLCQPCLLRYDFLGKVETVEPDSEALLAKVGAPRSLVYPRQQNGRSSAAVTKQHLAQLSPETRQKLYEFYFEDYMLFGYPLPSEANLRPI